MPHYAALVSMWLDSSLPENVMTNTLYFDDKGLGTDADGLADDILGVYDSKMKDTQMEVRMYDLADDKPRPVKGFASKYGGTFLASFLPRELALCLSYFSERNLPHQRGRIYLPYCMSGDSEASARPTTSQMQWALNFATTPNSSFPDIGGPDVVWCQRSANQGTLRPVTDGWVDDQWDTMRSRKLKPSRRLTFQRQG